MTKELDARVRTAGELMLSFAGRTGLESPRLGPRYLWTDAFAVCNFLGLARATGDHRYRELALDLVDRVHHALGRHRPDDPRSGWLSGLSEEEGERHPTRGGLRIGKALPERRRGEPFSEELEWERDGQYFHYLTKWMHALDQLSRDTLDARFNAWARELAETACGAFAHFSPSAGRAGIVWKMSIELDRALVPAMGHHDPLDGFVTCAELRATASRLNASSAAPTLEREAAGLSTLLTGAQWTTADPLGIGGLLIDACRLEQLVEAGAVEHAELAERVFTDAVASLQVFASRNDLQRRAEQRLAFRELGLAIGLAGIPWLSRAGKLLRRYAPIGAAIEEFWLESTHREVRSWREHRDINEVMLATSLAPAGFLLRSP